MRHFLISESTADSARERTFSALYDAYADRVYRFCLRLCGGSEADAEDLAQEVFVAAHAGLERFEGRSSVATWLYRIAVYRWRRLRDSRAWQVPAVSLDDGPEPASTQNDPARAGLARLSLEGALAGLSPDLREAFLLVKAEGLTYREAAEVLGAPQGTIQSRVHDAVLRLRSALSGDETRKEAAGNAL